MKKLIFILPLLITLSCNSQSWFPNGFWVGDSTVSGSTIFLIDSINTVDDTLAFWSAGARVPTSGGGGGGAYVLISDTVAMLTPYALLSEVSGVLSGGNGITLDGSDIDLGGALDAPTTITGTEVNDFNISMTDAGDRSALMRFDAADGLTMRAYNTDAFSGDSSIIGVDSSRAVMAVYDGAVVKYILVDTNAITLVDDDNGRGLTLGGDYSAGLQSLDVTPKIYADLHLGGVSLDATVTSPSASEHGGVLTYDTTGAAAGIDEYLITPVVEVAQAAGMMIESFDTIIFSTTTLDTIVVLPVGAVIWDIQVYLNTAFDGSGTNLLDVGIDGEGDRYINNFDLENPTATFYGLSTTPDRMAATTEITFQYTDSGADAGAGLAFIYVKYTIH